MKLFERLLAGIAFICLGGTVVLGVGWMAVAAYMLVTGAPNSSNDPALIAETSGTAAAAETATHGAQAKTGAAAPAPGSDLAAASAASLEHGAKVFRKCKACHVAEADGAHKTGPNLWNIVGRAVASADGFSYSEALSAKGDTTWTPEALQEFITNPKAAVQGTSMSFGGLKSEKDRNSVLLFLGQQADIPLDAAALGVSGAVAAASVDTPEPQSAASADVEIEPVPYPEGVVYENPPARSAEAQAEIDAKVAALSASVEGIDYERARFHPLHFPPQIETASNEECLVCHKEILDHKPREMSPAGRSADETLAWYQTLDTYAGDQATFHYRHLESDFAKQVMNLQCTFCHKGNDPREESPDMMRSRAALTAPPEPEFTLRKMVNPSKTCLRCHGAMPSPVEIMGLSGPWHEVRADMEWPEAPNGCLSCHAETYRTVRHLVSYLNAANIEKIAREGSSDTCYGCHGGRSWYRISYPYPRHPWPEMFDDETPPWAVGRPTTSDPQYALPASE